MPARAAAPASTATGLRRVDVYGVRLDAREGVATLSNTIPGN